MSKKDRSVYENRIGIGRGGAMRGIYTAGVLDIMLEHHIDVDGVVGVSAGAVFGCNYKSKQRSEGYRKKAPLSRC